MFTIIINKSVLFFNSKESLGFSFILSTQYLANLGFIMNLFSSFCFRTH